MSIRTRLTIAIALIFMITIALLGWTMVETTRSTLTRQIDDQVVAQAERRSTKPYAENKDPDPEIPYVGQGQDEPTPTENTPYDAPSKWQRRDFATLVYAADGTLLEFEPYGYEDDPASPPLCPEVPSVELNGMLGQIVTVPSVDGTLEYRTLFQQMTNGEIQAVGAPLTGVNNAIDDLVRKVMAGGSVAVLAAAALSWWFIRRGLQPVDHMVDTAAAIAGGDLGARINNVTPGTELGRLGIALNEMMSQIQSSDDARAAGERRLRRFVADAAHELRTPLTSLRGYAELYRQGALPDEVALNNAMGRIESEGARMARLVDDLLLLARMDQARGVERRPVDLAEMVTDAVDDFRVVTPNHPVTVEVEPIMVAGDRMRLRQVIDNLLSNVRTHTPAGTSVQVRLTRDGDRAVLVVADNGPGISPEDQEHIFERFWRADPARTRSRGGTGLGLAIVASLVEAHGGTISIHETVGGGITFTISVPIEGPSIEPELTEE